LEIETVWERGKREFEFVKRKLKMGWEKRKKKMFCYEEEEVVLKIENGSVKQSSHIG
jgi:hypothetical protein